MMNILELIAEEKIKEAIRNGEFENLSGKGRPLESLMDDLSNVPEEMRVSYIVLKNAGVLPEEIQLQKEIVNMQDLIACCYDEGERTAMEKKMNEKLLRLNIIMEKRNGKSLSMSFYAKKIENKMGT